MRNLVIFSRINGSRGLALVKRDPEGQAIRPFARRGASPLRGEFGLRSSSGCETVVRHGGEKCNEQQLSSALLSWSRAKRAPGSLVATNVLTIAPATPLATAGQRRTASRQI